VVVKVLLISIKWQDRTGGDREGRGGMEDSRREKNKKMLAYARIYLST
jgi:hypothetical protein